MSPLTWRISAEPAVFPGQRQHRTGIPSRVTARPMMICGRSSRLSLDLPWVRNPAALSGSACSPPAAFSPRQFRATSSSASSSSKYVEAVSKNSRSASRPGRPATAGYTCFSSSPRTACSQSIARSQASSLTSPSPPRCSPARIVPMPSRRHSASSTYAPPYGRDSVNTSSSAAGAASAPAGSSSFDSDATSRRMASLSSRSSWPKLCSTFGTDRRAAASHSLCARCRYRTSPPLTFRVVVFTYIVL
jgi:hypothetical protein